MTTVVVKMKLPIFNFFRSIIKHNYYMNLDHNPDIKIPSRTKKT